MKNIVSAAIFMIVFSMSLMAQESEVVLHTRTGDIKGTINRPADDSKDVVALLIAGSGPTDRDGNNGMMKNNSLKYLSQKISDAGVASVRFDKRLIAASANTADRESDMRFGTYVDDVRQWIVMLTKEYGKVILAGHSEGALIAIMAADGNDRVAGIISIAGAGRKMSDILKEQLSVYPDEFKQLIYNKIDTLSAGDSVLTVPPMLMSLFRPSVQPYLKSCFRVDPAVEIAKLTIPVMILQGDTDIQVTPEDARLLKAAYPSADLRILPNVNHVLKYCETTDKKEQIRTTYNAPDVPLAESVAQAVTDFVTKIK